MAEKTKKPKLKKQTIKVSCLFMDGQDGGWSVTVFPDAKAAEAAKREGIIDRYGYGYGYGLEGDELDAKVKEEWDDEYENGYIDTSEIKVTIDEKGSGGVRHARGSRSLLVQR